MPVTIVVPQLGESVVEGTVGKWVKKEGDPIAKDEPIVEIITDKINIELPAPAAGKLGKITIPEGTVAQVGQELGVILGQGESLPAGGGGAGAPAGAGATPQRQQGPPARPAPAPNAGAASQGGAPTPEPAPARAGTAVAEPSYADDQRVSPAVRKLVKEHNLDLSGIRGSGMGGRVTREDVLNHIEAGKVAVSAGAPRPDGPEPAPPGKAPASAPPRPTKPIPAPAFTQPGSREEEVRPLTNVRKKIAENMLRSRHSAAHCATWDEVDMTALVELRARLKERVRATYGVNLTYMPFIIKAV